MKQEIEKMKSRLLLLAFILMVPIGVCLLKTLR